jgi:STE24 endopeptidase
MAGKLLTILRPWSVCVLLVVLCCCAPAFIVAQAPAPSPSGAFMPSVVTVPAEAQAGSNFNANRATEAYLAQIPPDAKARSDSYFQGGYWLILWDFLYAVAVALLLLNLRWSAKFRDVTERITRLKPLQTFLYWCQYAIIAFVLSLPISIYEGYLREHKYGLATQTFGPWMGDQLKALLLSVVLGGLVVTALFGIVRRLRETWWIWGAVVTFIFFTIGVLISPVFIAPMFNTYKRLDDPKITGPILSLARANGIPVRDVFKVDASRQSTRMSANVSGVGGTMRITLNDNLLNRASPEEVQAVMGHEMGHYVLNHVYKLLLFGGVIIFLFFALLRWGLNWSLARWGERWQVRELVDPAIIPLVFLIASIFFFVLTPITNTYVRTQEHEADMYGINASRQPDGFAQAAIHLGEYRKMSPGIWEERIFFDHPSGRNRIHDAMQWKAENIALMESHGEK